MNYFTFVLLDVTDWEDELFQSIIKKHDIFHIKTPQKSRATPFIGSPDAIGELISECWGCDPSEYCVRLVKEDAVEAMKHLGKLVSFSEKEETLHVRKSFEVDYIVDEDGMAMVVGHRHYKPDEFLIKISKNDFELHKPAHELVNPLLGVDIVFGSIGTIEKGEGKYYNFIAYNGESKYKMTLHDVAFAIVTNEIKAFDPEEARHELSCELQKLFDKNKHIIGDKETRDMLSLVDGFYHEKIN